MDENQSPREEEDLLEWMPPELVERARTAAERDAHSAERRTSRQKKDKRGRAAALAVICSGLQLAAIFFALFGRRTEEIKGALSLTAHLLLAVLMLLVYLVFLLPWPQDERRKALAALTLLCCAVFFVRGAAVMRRGSAAEIVASCLGMLILVVLSPVPWLMLGALRRKHMRVAAVMAFLAVALALFVNAAKAANAQMTGEPAPDKAAAYTLLGYLQNLLLGVLLLVWPVVEQPILTKKGTGGSSG